MGMLHYSAQFANELAKKYEVYVAIADYYDGFLYDKNIKLLKIRTNPTTISFAFDSLAIRNQFKLWKQIKEIKPDIVHFMDNHPWYPFYIKICRKL
jgi:hypothetical protein